MSPSSPNQSVQPTGGSRFHQRVLGRHWRLPLVADAWRSAANMSKAINLFVILTTFVCAGCSTREPQQLSEKEFLERYHDVPLTPEGMATIIDDRNKLAVKKDTTDYAQAYASNVTDGTIKLRVLEALDRGDVAKAKRLLITTMNVDAGFLPVFGARAQISKVQREDASKFAKGYLDYLIAHTNEIQVGRVDFGGCFIGMGSLLENSPDDLIRLTNLIQSLGWPPARKTSAEQK
jgi:hypothetical protein